MSKRPICLIVHPTYLAVIYATPATHEGGKPCPICDRKEQP